jgi:lincosamide nucleotidyltransferase A/C/D/E
MDAAQLTDLLDRLAPVAPTAWLAGGWGVDALVGRQTRPHHDADVMLDADHLPATLALLHGLGYVTTEDWRPVRIEVEHPDGRRVDLHPVVLAPDGSGVQAGPHGTTFDYPPGGVTTGTVAGREVRCFTAAVQRHFRRGFPLRPVDHHDLEQLRSL